MFAANISLFSMQRDNLPNPYSKKTTKNQTEGRRCGAKAVSRQFRLQRILKVPNHKVTKNNHNLCYGLRTTATQFLRGTHKKCHARMLRRSGLDSLVRGKSANASSSCGWGIVTWYCCCCCCVPPGLTTRENGSM